MKKHYDAQEELRALYDLARSKGIVHTQKEFAELIGLNPANLSALLNGANPVTEQMMRRITDAAACAGVTGNGNATQDIAGGDMQKTYNSDHTAELLDEMRAQRELFADITHAHIEQIKQLTEAVTALANRK